MSGLEYALSLRRFIARIRSSKPAPEAEAADASHSGNYSSGGDKSVSPSTSLTDYEILVRCSNQLAERIRAAFGSDLPQMERLSLTDGTQMEKLMYGDLIDCDELDVFTRQAGASHMKTLDDSEEPYDLGAVVGLIEQAIIVGLLFERERVRRVRYGEAVAKVGDQRDYGLGGDSGGR